MDIIEFTKRKAYFQCLEFLNRQKIGKSKMQLVTYLKISNAYGYFIFDQLHTSGLISINVLNSKTYSITITKKGKKIYSALQTINQEMQDGNIKKIRTLHHALKPKKKKDANKIRKRKSTHTIRRSNKKQKT